MRNIKKVFSLKTVVASLGLTFGLMATNTAHAFCYSCNSTAFIQEQTYATQPFNSFYSQWQAQVGTVGNFQTAMSLMEEAINARLTLMEQRLLIKLTQSDGNINSGIEKMAGETGAQMTAYGQGQIQKDAAISYRKTQQKIKQQINDTQTELEQPATNCMQYSVGQNLTTNFKGLRKNSGYQTFASIISALNQGAGTGTQAVVTSYDKNMELFNNDNATEAEAKDADINGSLLFGSTGGDSTRYKPVEDQGVSAFIEHIVGLNYLPTPKSSESEKGFEGKKFANLRHRMATYLGTAEYSLRSVASYSQAVPDLKEFYTAAKLTPSADVEQYGVSVLGVLDTYVQKMMSPAVINDLTSTTSEEKILRQMLQTQVMRLMINLQKAQIQERLQVLSASKLALLQEEYMKERAETLKTQASFSGR